MWNPCILNRFQAVSSSSWLYNPLGRKAIQFIFSKGKSVMCVHFWTVDERCPRWEHCTSLYLTEQSLSEVLHIRYAHAQSLFMCWFCFSGNQEQWRQPCKECFFQRSAGYLWALVQHWPCLAPAEWLKHSQTQPAWAAHPADMGHVPFWIPPRGKSGSKALQCLKEETARLQHGQQHRTLPQRRSFYPDLLEYICTMFPEVFCSTHIICLQLLHGIKSSYSNY